MASSRRVLVVDNDPDVLRSVRFNLEMAGYSVLVAQTPEDAREIIANEIFHMAILDIRLDDQEELVEDQKGFEIAKELPPYIPFLVFTAYEDKKNIRLALGDVGARDILSKVDEPPEQLINKVSAIFAEIQINFDLKVTGPIKTEVLSKQLNTDLESDEIAEEEDDVLQILRKLFHKAESVQLSPLLEKDSQLITQPESMLIKVKPQYPEGWGAPIVVKISHRDEIVKESQNQRRIKNFLGGNRLANLEAEAYSRGLGGVVYRLIGAQTGEQRIQTFSEIFFERTPQELIALLRRFFQLNFAMLFADAGLKSLNLTTLYTDALHLTPQKLLHALLPQFPGIETEVNLTLAGVDESILNPYLWMVAEGQFREFAVDGRFCLCHGDLHSQNILVESNDYFWLIDFARTEESHALRDFAELESDIKFHLLPDDIPLNQLVQMEKSLLMPTKFADIAPSLLQVEGFMLHSYRVIVALREIASELIQLHGDMREYYIALLFHTLNVIRLRHVTESKKSYALLAAGLICERLQQWPDWSDGQTALYYPQDQGEAVANGRSLSASTLSAWRRLKSFFGRKRQE